MTTKPLSDKEKQLCYNCLETIEQMLDIIDIQVETLPQSENFTDDIQRRIQKFREKWGVPDE